MATKEQLEPDESSRAVRDALDAALAVNPALLSDPHGGTFVDADGVTWYLPDTFEINGAKYIYGAVSQATLDDLAATIRSGGKVYSPLGFTGEYLFKGPRPDDWSEQLRRIIAEGGERFLAREPFMSECEK